MDKKVIDYFNLEEKTYNYHDLIKYIDTSMTNDMMDDICGKCEWYPISNCRNAIIYSNN